MLRFTINILDKMEDDRLGRWGGGGTHKSDYLKKTFFFPD